MEKKYLNLTKEKVAYYDEGHQDSSRETILLIHGNTSSSSFFIPLITILSKNDRVIAPDLRGYGDSSYNHEFNSFEELSEDIIELLRALSIKKVLVLGWSLGGGVATQLAIKYPTIFTKLYLLNSTPCNGFPLYKEEKDNGEIIPYLNKEEISKDPVKFLPIQSLLDAQNAQFFDYILLNSMYNVNKPDSDYQSMCVKEALKMRCLRDADWSIVTFNPSKFNSPYAKGSNELKKLNIPIYLTFSKNDLIVTESLFKENVRCFEGLNAKVIIFENSGHSPIVDELDKLAQTIQELLKK